MENVVLFPSHRRPHSAITTKLNIGAYLEVILTTTCEGVELTGPHAVGDLDHSGCFDGYDQEFFALFWKVTVVERHSHSRWNGQNVTAS
jgi:hypothetical protein